MLNSCYVDPENIVLIFLWNIPAIRTYFDPVILLWVIYFNEITVK